MTSDQGPGEKDRKAERHPVSFQAVMRRPGGSKLTVDVRDLSTHGFRAEAHADIPVGSIIWLTVPGLESLPARVVWTNYEWTGAEFERPLHPAVLARYVER